MAAAVPSTSSGAERAEIVSDLPNIILKRKEEVREEARRKLAADLETIRSSCAKNDGRNALEILPKEMWARILKLLSDPKDIENAGATCLIFNALLEEKYFSRVLFPQVFSLEPFRRIFDKGLPLPINKITKLRSINKQWRDGVDAYFEQDVKNAWETSPTSGRREGHSWMYLFPPYGRPKHETKVDQVLADLNVAGPRKMVNPKLFQRNVSIDLQNRSFQHGRDEDAVVHDELLTMLTKVSKFLEAVGSQVLTCMIHFDADLTCKKCIGQVYRILCEWVKLMPEVQLLKVFFLLHTDADDAVRVAIEENSFPTLSNLLYTFVGLGDTDAEMSIHTAILNSNPQLKYLYLWTPTNSPPKFIVEGIQRLKEVEWMTLRSDGESTPLTYPSIMNRNWPLKRLFLPDLKPTVVPRLFRFLENFQSLESLDIGIIELNGRGGDPGFLKLPNLTYLNCVVKVSPVFSGIYAGRYTYRFCRCGNCYRTDIQEEDSWEELSDSDQSYDSDSDDEEERKRNEEGPLEAVRKYSLDFLIPMKRLETVIWRTVDPPLKRALIDDDENWKTEIIKFRGGKLDMNNSNIWDILPKLKKIVVNHDERYPDEFEHLDIMFERAAIFRRRDREKKQLK